MSKPSVKVEIPQKVEDLLDLGVKIYNKFLADGDKSPLNTLVDYNWNVIGPNLELAKGKNDEAEILKGKMEQAYQDRNNLLGDISMVIRASKNMLLPVYINNPKTLVDYGFTVNYSTKVKKTPTVGDKEK